MTEATKIEARLAEAREELEAARTRLGRMMAKGDTPELRGYESFGVRGRKPVTDSEVARISEAHRRVEGLEAKVHGLECRLERAKRDAAATVDLASLKPGALVRDSVGWHRVLKVNAKSVTVETPWSWTDRIPLDQILETEVVEVAA